MSKYYSINDVAMMTGLSTRTIRNYIKMNILDGEKVDGVILKGYAEIVMKIMNDYYNL